MLEKCFKNFFIEVKVLCDMFFQTNYDKGKVWLETVQDTDFENFTNETFNFEPLTVS